MVKNLKGDLLGGVTASVIALPLALAFGVASGAGAIAGLYGAIALGFFASIFGGTKTQISGPTGPMTVIVASVIAMFDSYESAIFVFILAGFFQILMGVIKVGKFIQYIPYPVISGFMSGIGIIIIILQINPIIGSSIQGSPLEIILNLHDSFRFFDFDSFSIGVLTIAIVFFTPKKLAEIVPPTLIAIVVVTIISVIFDFNIARIGEIPTALPSLHLPEFDLDMIKIVVPYAFTLALLGSIDSLLTSLVADSLTKDKHSPNRELIGQGIGNMVTGFIGGVPGAGATMRTVVNVKSGGTSRISGVVHSISLASILFGGAFLVESIPLALLAGILIKVGIDILDYRLIKNLKNTSQYDLYVMFTVLVLTIFVDLIVAVSAGIVLSSLLLIYRINRQINVEVSELSSESKLDKLHQNSRIRVIKIDGPLFFGSTSEIINTAKDFIDERVIILDCTKVTFMDLSAIFALEEMLSDLKGKSVILALRKKATKDRVLKLGMAEFIGAENIFIGEERAKRRAIELSKIAPAK